MPADIPKLEMEFAKNPTLEACLPLCEAYLDAKRFMEAMVVVKKGIKGSPTDPRGRVLLARVYADQGKLPKAEQELQGALQEFPGSPIALEMMGRVLMEQGKRDEAAGALQAALQSDPNLSRARNMLQQLGFAAPPPVQVAPQPVPQAAPVMATPPRPVMPMPQGAPPPVPQAAPPRTVAAAPQRAAPPPAAAPFNLAPMAAPLQNQAFAPPPVAAQTAMPQAITPEAAGEAAAPLEHVNDFFAPEALGFSGENSEIETAGPGRLTILGFVPKNTGSIKTTIVVALALFAVAGVFILYQYITSQNTRKISKLFGEVRAALEDDRYARYNDAIKRCEEILKVDESHNLGLSALAYANAILEIEYNTQGGLAKAKDAIKKAEDSEPTPNEYRAAAKALIAYAAQQYDAGLAELKTITDKGGSSPLIELEAFRLLNISKPDSKEAQVQLRRLITSVTSQARIYDFLGWYYLRLENWAQADKNFSAALQNSNGHVRALVGQALTDLGRGMGLKERQKDVDESIKKVLTLPPEELTNRTMALGRFARAQLREWQSQQKELPAEQLAAYKKDAAADYAEAYKLDPDNSLFSYRRGSGLLALGSYKEAAENLRHAAAKEPNNVRYYKKLAEAQFKSGDFNGAKASIERAGQLAPDDVDVKLLAGKKLREEKKFADAVTAYKVVTREMGGEPHAQAQIGISETMRESGKKAEAVKFMEDYLANAPSAIGPETQARLWCELGQGYEQTRNLEKARQSYMAGVDQFRFFPDCHYYLCRMGGAKESCKLYTTLAPTGEFAADAARRAK